MPCANQSLGTEGRILFAPSRAGVPHLSGFIFESLARHGCVLPRAQWAAGSISKFGPLIKRMHSPMGVRSMWGSYADRRSVPDTRAMPCANQSLGTEGRILFAPSRAGVPHLSGFIFESLARHGCVLPRARWAAGSISKFGPLIKRMHSPMGVRGMWGIYAVRLSVLHT